MRYATKLGLESEIVDETESSMVLRFDGKGAAEAFKNESGKHCVQRVPPTESKGRRHTSFVSVAVMNLKDSDVYQLDEKDVEMSTTRGGGPGGQAINKLENTAVAVHKPTGIRVRIQTRSQWTSKQMAMQVLAQKVQQHEEAKRQAERNAERKQQVGDGSRSGKIRTYNFIESTVTDHRLGSRTSKIKDIMKGSFDLLW